MESQQKRNIGAVFWDAENCSISANESKVLSNMTEYAQSQCIDIQSIHVFGHNHVLLPFQIAALKQNPSRLIVHNISDDYAVAGIKQASDIRILQQLTEWTFTVKPPASIILVSGDSDFYPIMKFLTSKGYDVHLIYPKGRTFKSYLMSDFKTLEYEQLRFNTITSNVDGTRRTDPVVQTKNPDVNIVEMPTKTATKTILKPTINLRLPMKNSRQDGIQKNNQKTSIVFNIKRVPNTSSKKAINNQTKTPLSATKERKKDSPPIYTKMKNTNTFISWPNRFQVIVNDSIDRFLKEKSESSHIPTKTLPFSLQEVIKNNPISFPQRQAHFNIFNRTMNNSLSPPKRYL
ncbi:NYN domain-containing protein [Globomyces pollinis-pini]|nr:NYN domain-containing protein [Globomyces pollinis-pini]